MEGKTLKVILAVCMIFAALFVVITCVWKLVKESFYGKNK
jgi:hypothetical protein